jgi:hypothetical protein
MPTAFNSLQKSPQVSEGLQAGPNRPLAHPRNPLNSYAGPVALKPMNPYGIWVNPPSQVQPGNGFAQYFPTQLSAVLSQFKNVFRSPILAQRIARSPNIHAIRLLQRQFPNMATDMIRANTGIGPNNLPRRIPGPRISSTSPVIAPVYDYGAQPLG